MILGIHPYVIVEGRGKEAIEFYKEAIDAQILQVQTLGDMPDDPASPITEEAKALIINAHLKVGESDLMISDSFMGQTVAIGGQVTISLTTDIVDETKRIFAKLADDGEVKLPLEKTFWSQAYGQVTDKFGVTWQITTM